MRKIVAIILCALVALSLTACGGEAAPEGAKLEPMAPETAAPAAPAAEAEDASDTDAAPAPAAPEPEEGQAASGSDAAVSPADMALFQTAQDCVGQSREELTAALGEPQDAQYAPSCLEEGAEDGMLFYTDLGFYVWTVRDGEQEIVHEVYLLD